VAYYLVRGKPVTDKVEDLKEQIQRRDFITLQPFGRAISYSLENACIDSEGWWTWEEEDYCSPPLEQERKAVLDRYFHELRIEKVEEGSGWHQIRNHERIFSEKC
jgi:hypothetical protein